MKDDLNKLFKDACPEPEDNAEFTSAVIQRIAAGKPRAAHHGPHGGFVGLFCSPIPVILIVAVLIVVFRDRIAALVRIDLGTISSDILLIAACCVAVIATILFYIMDLSDSRSLADWDSLSGKI